MLQNRASAKQSPFAQPLISQTTLLLLQLISSTFFPASCLLENTSNYLGAWFSHSGVSPFSRQCNTLLLCMLTLQTSKASMLSACMGARLLLSVIQNSQDIKISKRTNFLMKKLMSQMLTLTIISLAQGRVEIPQGERASHFLVLQRPTL